MVEFAASNHINASTKMIPFVADHEFHPCTSIKLLDIYNSE